MLPCSFSLLSVMTALGILSMSSENQNPSPTSPASPELVASSATRSPRLAVVVIGRNEGERLRRCLASVRGGAEHIVYVDSGSSDGSAEHARSEGFEVVELDMSIPFSAARARNAGFARLGERGVDAEFVQFVDGDCEVHPEWLGAALEALVARPEWAIVCGRRRERAPESSLYNRLCDVEWDTPIGEATACGGDFLVRARVFSEVGGFNPTVVAGEEPELCHRIRGFGHKVVRLDREMTLHDAAMTRFGQFWRRAERAGYAYALVAALHFRSARRIWVKQVASIVVWALLPLVLVAAAFLLSPLALVGFLLYPLLWAKMVRHFRVDRGLARGLARAYAAACVVGKFAEFRGVLRAACDVLFGRARTIIEYKSVGAS